MKGNTTTFGTAITFPILRCMDTRSIAEKITNLPLAMRKSTIEPTSMQLE